MRAGPPLRHTGCVTSQPGVEFVEADLVAHVSRLYSPPFGRVVEQDGMASVVTGIDRPEGNGVLRARPEDYTDEGVAALVRPFDELRVPMMWWLFTADDVVAERRGEVLARHGFRLGSNRPAMTRAVAGALPEPPWPVRRVRDRSAFRKWSDVVGAAFGVSDHLESVSCRSFLHIGFSDDAPFRHYVVQDDETPVGAATLSFGAGVAGLGNIATRTSHRRRKIATAVIGAALAEASELGITVAALSADPGGDRFYRGLGFVEVGRHLTFERGAGGIPAGRP